MRRGAICIFVAVGLALGMAYGAAAPGESGAAPAAAAQTAAAQTTAAQTTQEHVKSAAWWPTKPLPNQDKYVGAATCGKCHRDLLASQRTSQMARTLRSAADSVALRDHLHAEYRSGPYTYTVGQQGADFAVHVSDATEARDAVLQWAIGSGDVGQSYLWQQDKAEGRFCEARFNYFSSLNGFAATPGRLHGPPASLEMAVGRPLEEFEFRSCFSCHSATMSSASPLDVTTIVPGVSCEACHGPGADHVAAMQSAASANGVDKHIVNPARMAPAQAVDLCGACHSTPWDVRLMGAAGVQTVRFPAYRLEKSRCWGRTGDARLTCAGCHNPHQPLARDPAAYDSACLRCHSAALHPVAARAGREHAGATTPRACPVATTKCVSCHMPKYELPEMHYKFTDHNIRVVSKGEAFPD